MGAKIRHLKKSERKARLGTNNEHTMTSSACYDNRQKLRTNMESGQTDIDNLIDAHCFENNFHHLM